MSCCFWMVLRVVHCRTHCNSSTLCQWGCKWRASRSRNGHNWCIRCNWTKPSWPQQPPTLELELWISHDTHGPCEWRTANLSEAKDGASSEPEAPNSCSIQSWWIEPDSVYLHLNLQWFQILRQDIDITVGWLRIKISNGYDQMNSENLLPPGFLFERKSWKQGSNYPNLRRECTTASFMSEALLCLSKKLTPLHLLLWLYPPRMDLGNTFWRILSTSSRVINSNSSQNPTSLSSNHPNGLALSESNS